MDKISLLFTHYNDTCEIQNNQINSRNKLFIYLCIANAFLFLLMIDQNGIIGIIEEFAQSKYEISILLSAEIIMSLIWVVTLYLSMRYIQTNIRIERQYNYINKLEEQLSKESNQVIGREGSAYAENYPFVLNYIDFLYKWIIPILFMLVVLVKIIIEIAIGISTSDYFDLVIALADILMWIGYLVFLHHNKKSP